MTTKTAILRRVGGFDNNDRPASVCSFAQQTLLEVAPASVQDALGKAPVDHRGYRQILDRNPTEPKDQIIGQFIQEVLPLIGNVFRETRQGRHGFPAIGPAAFPSGYPPLKSPQLPLRFPIPPGIIDRLTRGQREETAQSGIDADLIAVLWKWAGLDGAAERGIPLVGLPADAHRLDGPVQLPMPANRDAAASRELQPSALQPKAVTVFFEAERSEPITSLEPWITGLLASFYAPEESGESLVQVGNHNLQNVAMNRSGQGIVGLVDLDAAKLFRLAYRVALGLIGRLPLSQTVVVEPTGSFQDGLQPLPLAFARIQAIGEDLEQSQSFLGVEVPLHGGRRYVASRTGEVAPSPQRGQLEELRKLLPQLVRRKSLALLHDFGGRVGRPAANKQVDVVWFCTFRD
jgi:hypothetical protein